MSFFDFILGRSPPKPATPQPQAPAKGLLAAPSGATQKAYQDYVIDAQSSGKPALSFADWSKQQVPAK